MTDQKKSPKTKEKKEGKDVFAAPKGMRDLIGEDFFKYQGFFEKAAEIALYYGFGPIETPMLEETDVFIRSVGESSDIVEKELYSLRTKGGDHLALRPEFTAAIMRAYLEHGMQSWPQPVQLYTFGPLFRHDRPQKGRYRDHRQFDIEIIGSEKSMTDAMVIHIIHMILEEVGVPNINFEINSLGDKECRGNFRRELVNYYKKHLAEVCSDCTRRFKENPLRLLDCKNEKCQPIKEGAPDPVSSLCDECRKHFKEVLEYVEALGVPYSMNRHLVRGLDYYTRTTFEIFSIPEEAAASAEAVEGEETLPALPLAIGGGGRYDYLAKELGSNRPTPGVGSGIGVDRILSLIPKENVVPRLVKKPKVYFIQLGFDAKLKSLSIVEILRKAKIPVMHSLSKDSLGGQLATAEKLEIPYTIILGQKEVIENAVIVRNMENRSQQSVPVEKLAEYLKKLK